MSFTSLQSSDKSAPKVGSASADEESGVGAIPLSFGTFDVSDASNPLIQTLEPSQVSLSPADNYEAGNLAALEDHAPDAPLDSRSMSSMLAGSPHSQPRYDPNVLTPGHSQSHLPAPPPGSHPHSAPPQTSGPSTLMWVVFALLLVVAVATAVHFAGVLE